MFGKKDSGKPALSKRANNNRGCMVLFGAIFAIAGAAIMHFFFFVPVSKWALAQNWEMVECRILSSDVGSHSDDDGTTYSIDIRYRYEYDGNEYVGENYDFIGGSSSGYDGKKAVVDQYPAGTDTFCFVDPDDPADAVLTIEFQWTYFIGLFGGIFFGVGMFIMFGKIGGTSNAKGRDTWLSDAAKLHGVGVEQLDIYQATTIVLKPTVSRWAKLIIAVVFVAVWDGVSGFLVYSAWTEEGFGMLDVFALIFGGIGILVFFWVPYQLLALMNPVPELTLNPGIIPVGALAHLSWRFTGGTQRLQNLAIHLVGKEEATYRQGTDTRTATSTFLRLEIARSDNFMDMQEGAVNFVVPITSMHSFDAPNNKIKWSITVKGDIPKWPNVDEEFPIVVRPMMPSEWRSLVNADSPTGE